MKTIKEYINESLFDDENDLLDKKPDQAMINWLEKNTSGSSFIQKNFIFVNNGAVYNKAHSYFRFDQNPPSWIKFDEKSWAGQGSELTFDIKSQKDISNIPGWIEHISGNIVKDVDINTFDITFGPSVKEIKNVSLHWDGDNDIRVTLTYTNPTEDTLMNISAYENSLYIDIYKTKLCEKLKRGIKKYGTTDFYNRNMAFFRTLYENKIRFLKLSVYAGQSYGGINIYSNYITYEK